ncbi:MAG: acyltransferase [Acidobacteriota bacterium]|nr:acyltransferase [Acidobacteriota bacterium]
MDIESQGSAGAASVFNVRHNWNHLMKRPAFQEPVIDGVRALAILWVVLFHIFFFHGRIFPVEVARVFTNPATSWIQNGTLGVDLFFVISGFLMGSILFGEMKKSGGLLFSRFYVRRFLRLIPVYAAAMLLGLYFLHNFRGPHGWGHAESVWANLLYVNNLLPYAKQYMGWCWSLAIEEQFYLVLPAFILLFMRLGKGRFRVLAFLMILSVAIRLTVIHFSGIVPPLRFSAGTKAFNAYFDVIYDKPWMRFGGLLAGVAGAYLNCYFATQLRKFFVRTGLVTTLAVLCLGVFAHISSTGMGSVFFDRIPYSARQLWWAVHLDVLSLAAIFLILAAIHTPRLFGGWLRGFLSWKGFYPVAQLSYSIYLTHEMLFVWLFRKVGPGFAARLGNFGTIAVDAAIGLAMTMTIAATFYVTIERPCMRMRSSPGVLRFIEFFRRRHRQQQLAPAEVVQG